MFRRVAAPCIRKAAGGCIRSSCTPIPALPCGAARGDSKIIDLPEGTYTIKAEGSKKEVIVEVKKDTATPQEEVTE